MRAVRCDACGAKAMIAAAQCPKCGHLFELRDGFGALLPLAYCSSCESYYPASLGECKWCGTKPERAPIAPQIWRGVGAVALAVLVAMAWVFHRQPEPDGSRLVKRMRANAAAASEPQALPVDTAIQQGSLRIDSASSTMPVASADSAGRTPANVVSATEAPSVQPTPLAAQTPPMVSAQTAAMPITVRPSSKSKRAPRWVSSVSRDWVVVRTDANKLSRIVASIGPNSHVQLGETRGSWRRIRARGVNGWVEPRASFDVATR